MRNKNLAFAKNFAITAGVAIAAGAGISEVANHFTDNGKIIGFISTTTQYLTSFGVFFPLQARDNIDIYGSGKNFRWKEFISDNLKFSVGLTIIDLTYLLGRPFIQNYFIKKGFSGAESSLISDSLAVTSYLAASYPIARISGVIRGKKRQLEKQIEKI